MNFLNSFVLTLFQNLCFYSKHFFFCWRTVFWLHTNWHTPKDNSFSHHHMMCLRCVCLHCDTENQTCDGWQFQQRNTFLLIVYQSVWLPVAGCVGSAQNMSSELVSSGDDSWSQQEEKNTVVCKDIHIKKCELWSQQVFRFHISFDLLGKHCHVKCKHLIVIDGFVFFGHFIDGLHRESSPFFTITPLRLNQPSSYPPRSVSLPSAWQLHI